MTQTVFGVLADELGHATTTVLEQGRTRPELRRKVWANPAAEFRHVQAPQIPIDHGGPVGELLHLERRHGNLWAVGHVHDSVIPAAFARINGETIGVPHPLFWSPATRSTLDHRDIVLDSVALTTATARVYAKPVTILPGNLNYMREPPSRWKLQPAERELLTRACATLRARRETRWDDPLVIDDLDTPPETSPRQVYREPTGPVEIRSAATAAVSVARRVIALVVMPYESVAVVPHQGRMIEEVCSRGAFNELRTSTRRVTVNRDHQLERTVGLVEEFHPDRPEGLVAEIRIARTPLGDETLTLADEGILDCSAGFMVRAQRWEGSRRRRLTDVHLHHVALTPDPAYEDARVLAVGAS